LNTQPFGFSVAELDGTTTVRLSGEIDYAASLAIGPELNRLVGRGSDIHFDLDRVTLIDSEGIKMILDAARSAEMQNRRASVVRCSDRVDRILRLAGVYDCLVQGAGCAKTLRSLHSIWRC
jgi:anti-anti-sigma factor